MQSIEKELVDPSEKTKRWIILVFDRNNRLSLKEGASGLYDTPIAGMGAFAEGLADEEKAALIGLREIYTVETAEATLTVGFAIAADGSERAPGVTILPVGQVETFARERLLTPLLAAAMAEIEPHLVDVPYLDLSENEYIYRFRTARERNREVYVDAQSESLYQSKLCSAIKAVRRIKEKTSGDPVELDFGAVKYVLPSHFGFCLGVQNAIERAYEAVAQNPGKRIYMLSELIHNPYVNADLRKRGLCYLQSDKGEALDSTGNVVPGGRDDPRSLWAQLTEDDAVIIPAFGATNEDKIALIRRGVAVRAHDATCMLVEKVWKAARRYSQEGYTVIIHGKAEHEETKATFSNSARFGPSLILRNMEHVRVLGTILLSDDPKERAGFYDVFRGFYSEGFDVERDLARLAVVNQTTLLRNETLRIIDYLREILTIKYGPEAVADHLWSKGKGDTLCYATQVNQDALVKAVEMEIDVALVVGGKNSSNTFQLFRMCEATHGDQAYYIQSEENILSRDTVRHYVFPYLQPEQKKDQFLERPFLPAKTPLRVLLTGGASCPDGIIQQVMNRINGFFPPDSLRSVDEVLAEVEALEIG